MTLGKKLSGYRTINGLTQGQLGEKLNVSAQAVSKWENDLTSPDIATLKMLAELYKVTLDELVDLKCGFGAPVQDESAEGEEDADEKGEQEKLIGFCKSCGITVTEDNLGEREPVILCKKCRENKIKEETRLREEKIEQERRLRENAQLAFKATQTSIKRKRNISFIVAGLVALTFLIIGTVTTINKGLYVHIATSAVLTYAIFAFVALLFYDGVVPDLLVKMCTASIRFPGLIFTFDLDGFIWLIGMKILFAVIGFIFGVACTILGVLLGLALAPFVFPFKLITIHRAIATGDEDIFV